MTVGTVIVRIGLAAATTTTITATRHREPDFEAARLSL